VLRIGQGCPGRVDETKRGEKQGGVEEGTLRKGRPRFVAFIMCDDVACGWGSLRSACGGIAGGGEREGGWRKGRGAA